MILSYLSHKKIEINESGLKVILTTSPIAYKNIIQGFQNKNQLLICSNDDYEQLEVKKAFDFVGDPLLNENIDERYMTQILKSYVTNLDEENRNKIMIAFHRLESLLQDSLLLEDIPLEINFDEDLKKLLKIEELHLDSKLMNDPYAIIETILKIHEICNLKTIPVICNVAHYLDSQQLNELSKIVKQMNLKLILIEFTDEEKLSFLKNAEFFYIDQDLVDWY